MKKARLQAQLGVGAVLVGLVALMAVVAFVWTPYDPSMPYRNTASKA